MYFSKKKINAQGCHSTVHWRAIKRTGQDFSWKQINAQHVIITYSRVDRSKIPPKHMTSYVNVPQGNIKKWLLRLSKKWNESRTYFGTYFWRGEKWVEWGKRQTLIRLLNGSLACHLVVVLVVFHFFSCQPFIMWYVCFQYVQQAYVQFKTWVYLVPFLPLWTVQYVPTRLRRPLQEKIMAQKLFCRVHNTHTKAYYIFFL